MHVVGLPLVPNLIIEVRPYVVIAAPVSPQGAMFLLLSVLVLLQSCSFASLRR